MRLLVTLVLLCLALPASVLAQHGRQRVVAELDATAGPLTEGGFGSDSTIFARDELIGMLAESTSSYVEVRLEGGTE